MLFKSVFSLADVTNCQLLLNTLAPLNYYTKLCQKEGNKGPLKLNSKIYTEIRSDKISGKSGYRATTLATNTTDLLCQETELAYKSLVFNQNIGAEQCSGQNVNASLSILFFM